MKVEIPNSIKNIPDNIIKTANKTGETTLGILGRITKKDCFTKENASSAINKNTATGFAVGAVIIGLAGTCIHELHDKIKELKSQDK